MKPIPLNVSWMVSPSVPLLRLVAQEGTSGQTISVQFVAYDKRLDKKIDQKELTKSHIVREPSEFIPFDGVITKPYRLIRLNFYGDCYARFSPAFSDSQVIDESRFDWSDVPGRWKSGEDIFQYAERRDQQWYQTGICPNPRIYQIEHSDWRNEEGYSEISVPRLLHYMILGHDSIVEVLATRHIIIGGQMLDYW